MGKPRVLIAVQSEGLARVIHHVLRGQTGISGSTFADSQEQLLAQAEQLRPDLIILNSGLLGRNAGASLVQLKQVSPESSVIMTFSRGEVRRPSVAGVVHARVLDEALVQELPNLVRKLTHRPRPSAPTVPQFCLVLVLCLLGFSRGAYAQITDKAIYAPPSYYTLQPPAPGGTFLDPVFGTTMKRMSNSLVEPNAANGSGTLPFISTEYSSMSPFNADHTRILGLHFSYFGLYDGSGTFVRNLSVCASCEPRWSRTNPNLLYFISVNQLKQLDVATNVTTVIHTFSEYATITGKGESDISLDGDHFVFAGDATSVFVYELSTNIKGSVFNTEGHGFDSLYVTPNNNVTITWYQPGSERYNGIELFDRNMNFQRQVAHAGGHMDVTRDTNGDEILLWTNAADPVPLCPNAIVKIRLADAYQTCLISVDWNLAVHVSAPDTGGWFFMETYAPSDPAPGSAGWKTYTNEILQVKLDGSEVRRIAHHRSRPFDGYNYTPRVAASRDGTRLIFSSNFGLYGPSTLYTDLYLVVINPEPTPIAPTVPSVPVSQLSRKVRYEQNNAAVLYSADWSTNNLTVHSGGSAALAMNPGSRVSFTFSGTGIRWIGYRDEWSGLANVYVDNVLKSRIDTFASPAVSQAVIFAAPTLEAGTHTIVIEVLGAHSAKSGGSWIWVDAFLVTSSSTSMTASLPVTQSGIQDVNTDVAQGGVPELSGPSGEDVGISPDIPSPTLPEPPVVEEFIPNWMGGPPLPLVREAIQCVDVECSSIQ